MTTLYEGAFAKLNLTLDVLGKREDGYHDLQSVMQTISIRDDIEIDVGTGKPWKLQCSVEGIPTDETNLAWKAAKLFYEKIGKDPDGLTIHILKRIPMGAGLAGGSTDAAAVLRALDIYYKMPLSLDELCQLGAEVGSDVPFCILCGTAITEEKGQIMFPINHAPQTFYVICKPDASLSTKDMYEQLDREGIPPINDTKKIVTAIRNQNISLIAANLYNVFEPLAIQRVPEIAKIKQQLKQYGALGAQMTGSGSAVFGVFDSFEKAIEACDKLHEKYPDTFFATTSDFDTAD